MLVTFFVCLCVVLWKKQIVKTEYRQLVSASLGLFLVGSGWLELVSKHGLAFRFDGLFSRSRVLASLLLFRSARRQRLLADI